MKKLIIFAFTIIFFCLPIQSSEKDKIIKNLEKINNINFNFKQTIDGKTETGNCTIKYPKKIYCFYRYKYNKTLVSNGKSLVIKSEKNNQYYHYPLNRTPFELLLNKNYIINKIKKMKSKLLNEKYYNFLLNNENHKINVFFNKDDYNLTGWQTEDIYQNLVVTYIYDLKINEKINNKLFFLPERN